MSNYKFANPNERAPKRHEVHPVMRGISCITIVILPIISYIASDLLMNARFGARIIPPSWYGRMSFPPLLTRLNGTFGRLNTISFKH